MTDTPTTTDTPDTPQGDRSLIVIGKTQCGSCVATKKNLTRKGFEYTYIEADTDTETHETLASMTAYDYVKDRLRLSRMPVVLVYSTTVPDEDHLVAFWSGHNPDALRELITTKDTAWDETTPVQGVQLPS